MPTETLILPNGEGSHSSPLRPSIGSRRGVTPPHMTLHCVDSTACYRRVHVENGEKNAVVSFVLLCQSIVNRIRQFESQTTTPLPSIHVCKEKPKHPTFTCSCNKAVFPFDRIHRKRGSLSSVFPSFLGFRFSDYSTTLVCFSYSMFVLFLYIFLLFDVRYRCLFLLHVVRTRVDSKSAFSSSPVFNCAVHVYTK